MDIVIRDRDFNYVDLQSIIEVIDNIFEGDDIIIRTADAIYDNTRASLTIAALNDRVRDSVPEGTSQETINNITAAIWDLADQPEENAAEAPPYDRHEVRAFDHILRHEVVDIVRANYPDGRHAIVDEMVDAIMLDIAGRTSTGPRLEVDITQSFLEIPTIRDMDDAAYRVMIGGIMDRLWALGSQGMEDERHFIGITRNQIRDAIRDELPRGFNVVGIEMVMTYIYSLLNQGDAHDYQTIYTRVDDVFPAAVVNRQTLVSRVARAIWRLGTVDTGDDEAHAQDQAVPAAAADDHDDGWQQFVYQPQSMEDRKQAQLKKQDGERGFYLREVDADTREAYYVSALGAKYRDIKFFDAIMQGDTTIGAHIDEDLDNILFVIKDATGNKTPFATLRSQVQKQLAVYDCDDNGKKYINMTNLGAFGMASYDAIKTVVIHSNYQIFLLQNSGKKTGKLVTHEIRHFQDNIIGGFHCQEGTQTDYFQIHVPAMLL